MATIKVTKIEAAQRQIDAAIRMLFRNEDPVPIHTLVMAGFRILRDLASKSSESHMEASVAAIIKPGMESKLWGQFHSFSNFLKHADKDPNKIFDDVQEEVNDIALLLASFYYQDLGQEFTPEMLALVAWYTAIRPKLLRSDTNELFREKVSMARSTLIGLDRKEQLKIGSEILRIAKSNIQST